MGNILSFEDKNENIDFSFITDFINLFGNDYEIYLEIRFYNLKFYEILEYFSKKTNTYNFETWISYINLMFRFFYLNNQLFLIKITNNIKFRIMLKYRIKEYLYVLNNKEGSYDKHSKIISDTLYYINKIDYFLN